jgi:hypothetical protein
MEAHSICKLLLLVRAGLLKCANRTPPVRLLSSQRNRAGFVQTLSTAPGRSATVFKLEGPNSAQIRPSMIALPVATDTNGTSENGGDSKHRDGLCGTPCAVCDNAVTAGKFELRVSRTSEFLRLSAASGRKELTRPTRSSKAAVCRRRPVVSGVLNPIFGGGVHQVSQSAAIGVKLCWSRLGLAPEP